MNWTKPLCCSYPWSWNVAIETVIFRLSLSPFVSVSPGVRNNRLNKFGANSNFFSIFLPFRIVKTQNEGRGNVNIVGPNDMQVSVWLIMPDLNNELLFKEYYSDFSILYSSSRQRGWGSFCRAGQDTSFGPKKIEDKDVSDREQTRYKTCVVVMFVV